MINQLYTSNHITTYYTANPDKQQAGNRIDRIKNSGNEHRRNADISDVTKRKIKRMCGTWFELLKIYNFPRQKREQLRPTFTTLTYPILKTEDKEARKKDLNRFMIYLQRKGFMRRYIWKAEAQKNGSLHYHIISDQYIEKELVRETWNKCIADAIEIYGKEPFGTRIESVTDYDKAISYLNKYITKNSNERRAIEGNKWGSSENLKKMCYFVEQNETLIRLNQSVINDNSKITIQINDFVECAILNGNLLQNVEILHPDTKADILSTYERNYELLFNQQIIL